jgi:prolyl oligopeptidase
MPHGKPVSSSDVVTQLNQLYDDYWEFILKEYPLSATYLGDHRYDGFLEDASEDAFHRRVAQSKKYLDRLRSIKKPSSKPDLLNYELFERELEDNLESAKFRPYLTPMTQQSGLQIDIPELVTYHPFGSLSDFENFSSRLRAFPRLVDQVIQSMRTGVRAQIVLARVTAEKIIPQLEANVVQDPKKLDLYKSVEKIPAVIDSTEAVRIRNDVEEAIRQSVAPAFEKLLGFFKEKYLPECRNDVGIWFLPDGNERYAYAVRHYTTTNLSPDEIHDLGLKELSRIHGEMRAIVDRIGFKASLRDFISSLRRDRALYNPSAAELLAGFKKILEQMDEKLPLLFGRLPEAKYGFREIEAFRAEAAPDAYYYRPPEDGSRPAYFYVNTFRPEQRPKYTMEVLAYHEAVPGHHLQLAIQQELTDLPKFRRHGGYTAFIEGWGLYSEELPKLVGFYKDALSDFERLSFDAWRAARLVVDTGIHHEHWTRERAIQFFLENTALSELNIVSEVDRYIAWPGQALAYKIGQLKISELRTRAEKALGPGFDIRRFHDELLGDGALALDVLANKMEGWMARESGRIHS